MTRDILNSHRTAIGRIKPSAPARFLVDKNLVKGNVLDYGCGRGFDAYYYGWDSYDPHFMDDVLFPPYTTILCSYVLNTLTKKHEAGILEDITNLMAEDGVAYITVRRNVKKAGYTSKGTYQRNVVLDLPIVTENSDFCIYQLRK